MDHQTPAETVDATAQTQIDDQTLIDSMDGDQRLAHLRSLDQARAAVPLPKMEFYERFYDGQLDFAAGDPEQAAVAKRVKGIVMKHHETMVQWPHFENSDQV